MHLLITVLEAFELYCGLMLIFSLFCNHPCCQFFFLLIKGNEQYLSLLVSEFGGFKV